MTTRHSSLGSFFVRPSASNKSTDRLLWTQISGVMIGVGDGGDLRHKFHGLIQLPRNPNVWRSFPSMSSHPGSAVNLSDAPVGESRQPATHVVA